MAAPTPEKHPQGKPNFAQPDGILVRTEGMTLEQLDAVAVAVANAMWEKIHNEQIEHGLPPLIDDRPGKA